MRNSLRLSLSFVMVASRCSRSSAIVYEAVGVCATGGLTLSAHH